VKLVQKFGGTSLADIDCISKAAGIAVNAASDGHEVVAVVSAMGHTTDQLISLAKQVSQAPNSRELDMLLATGEQQSIALMTMAIQKLGWQARSFTGAQAGIITEGQYGAARIKEIETQGIEATLKRGEIAVVAGFQGTTINNEVTTLGRGGSDTTAVAIAKAIQAEQCDIYTDVRGVFTADPELVPQARRLICISYEEMLALASTGAQVFKQEAAELAMESSLPIRIRSTFAPEDQGTLITHRLLAPEYTVCGISLDVNQVFFRLKITSVHDDFKPVDAVSSLFTRLSELNITTDMVMLLAREDEPYQELMFTVGKSYAEKVCLIIDAYKEKLGRPEVGMDEKLARLSIVGRRFAGHPEIIASIFDTLSEAEIPIHMVTIGDLRMSILMPTELSNLALTQLHNSLGLSIDT
jgi:aspartate kinase